MGGDIVPYFVGRGEAGVYDMKRNDVPGSTDRDRCYWRDVGTIDSFFDAHHGPHLDAARCSTSTTRDWPIHSPGGQLAAGEVRARLGRAPSAPRSTRSCRSGRVLSGTHLERERRGPVDARRRRLDDHRLGAVRSRAGRSRGPACTARSSTRTSSSPRRDASASTATKDLPRGFTVTDCGITVVGKGVRVER